MPTDVPEVWKNKHLLGLDELSADELREIVIFLTHYAGWPSGAKMNTVVETLIAQAERPARGG